MKKVKQTSPESKDFHSNVKSSVGHRGRAHGIAKQNTGGAVNGRNTHNRRTITDHTGSGGMGGFVPGSYQSGC